MIQELNTTIGAVVFSAQHSPVQVIGIILGSFSILAWGHKIEYKDEMVRQTAQNEKQHHLKAMNEDWGAESTFTPAVSTNDMINSSKYNELL